jgi:hypothetical protein
MQREGTLKGNVDTQVGCWLPVVSYSDGGTTSLLIGRHGGSQHGKTTTDGHHSNTRQGTQEARW